jgi:hypothetical protein
MNGPCVAANAVAEYSGKRNTNPAQRPDINPLAKIIAKNRYRPARTNVIPASNKRICTSNVACEIISICKRLIRWL